MKWGDFIETSGHLDIQELELLNDQVCDSFDKLEGFDYNKPYKLGWFIEQADTEGAHV